jgi:hypothetical protein
MSAIVSITFTKDFANRKEGEVWSDCPFSLASDLINYDKVAVKTEDVSEKLEDFKPKAKTTKSKE